MIPLPRQHWKILLSHCIAGWPIYTIYSDMFHSLFLLSLSSCLRHTNFRAKCTRLYSWACGPVPWGDWSRSPCGHLHWTRCQRGDVAGGKSGNAGRARSYQCHWETQDQGTLGELICEIMITHCHQLLSTCLSPGVVPVQSTGWWSTVSPGVRAGLPGAEQAGQVPRHLPENRHGWGPPSGGWWQCPEGAGCEVRIGSQ